MVNSIRVKGFRSIIDSGDIELRPITAVVGKNSSGKSSFVRLFPLIRQTIEDDTSDPMLWYGSLVDFADFNNSTYQKQGHPITLSLNMTIPTSVSFEKKENEGAVRKKKNRIVPVMLSMQIQKHRFSSIIINFFDQKIEIKSGRRNLVSVSINGSSSLTEGLELDEIKGKHELLPLIVVKNKDVDNSSSVLNEYELSLSDYFFVQYIHNGNKYDIEKSINKYIILKQMPLFSQSDVDGIVDSLFNEDEVTHITGLRKNDRNYYKKFNNLLLLMGLENIINTINNEIRKEFLNTNYIKPIRAKAERYYRIQGISVDEVNSDGSNIPMILHNMSESKRQSFYRWTKERFGISFKAIPTGGHVSLVINDQETNRKNINLTDTGYGYSQLLPIVLLLWMAYHDKSMILNKRIVIEQPELHLHPAMQAKLARVMALVAKESMNTNTNINIVFETHSEAMINELGKLVSEGIINADSVSVLAFNKENNATSIKTCSFDEDGLLIDWPIGFFSTRD